MKLALMGNAALKSYLEHLEREQRLCLLDGEVEEAALIEAEITAIGLEAIERMKAQRKSVN